MNELIELQTLTNELELKENCRMAISELQCLKTTAKH